jgi:imidazolonepropionase-like amidohydrolase
MILALAALTANTALAQDKQEKQDKKDEQRTWTISADTVYTANGDAIENGEVSVSDGKIRSVGKGGGGELKVAAVTPGMVDLSVHIDRGFYSVEQSREVTPEMRVAEALDLFDEQWKTQAKSGVTTAMVNAPARNVIGGLSVVLKTAGEKSAAARTLKADAVLFGAMGSTPSQSNHPAFGRPEDFYSRRPTTRMGVEWEWRKAFYDAAAARSNPDKVIPGTAQLHSVLDGNLPLMIEAWTTQDIRTAVFLKEEIERENLGHPNLIVDSAAEAWKEPQLLVRSKASVVFPPFPPQGRTGDNAFFAWDTAKLLDSLGVPIAFSAHGESDVTGRLDRQAGFAMRGGLSFDAALRAVTINPARMVGVDKRVGSIESGKDADLVLWNGKPFEATSRVVGVLIDGRLILDPRPQSEK